MPELEEVSSDIRQRARVLLDYFKVFLSHLPDDRISPLKQSWIMKIAFWGEKSRWKVFGYNAANHMSTVSVSCNAITADRGIFTGEVASRVGFVTFPSACIPFLFILKWGESLNISLFGREIGGEKWNSEDWWAWEGKAFLSSSILSSKISTNATSPP